MADLVPGMFQSLMSALAWGSLGPEEQASRWAEYEAVIRQNAVDEVIVVVASSPHRRRVVDVSS